MKKQKQYVGCNCLKQACHPGSLLAGISLGFMLKGNEQAICIGKGTAEDPGQKPFGMTANFNHFLIIRSLAPFLFMGKASSIWSSLVHSAICSAPLAGEVRRSRVGGLSMNIPSALERAKCISTGVTRKGFTLIELLVVVLIIGILAAVALPQYQLAVAKSRTVTMLPIMKAITEAQERYFLENGNYAETLNELDIDIPATCTTLDEEGNEYDIRICNSYFLLLYEPSKSINASYCPHHNTSLSSCTDERDFIINFKLLHHATKPERGGERICTARKGSTFGKAICSSLIL